MKETELPKGWDDRRIRDVLDHYEAQSEDDAVAEDEAAYETTKQTMMEVPTELVPAVRELIAKHHRSAEQDDPADR